MDHVFNLLEMAQKGDKKARDTLVEENIGLVWSIVKRFTNRGYESEDLFQIGVIGLIKAIDYFNMDFEVKFSTYAVPMITGEIKRFLRDDGMLKVSRSIKDNAYKLSLAKDKLYRELGRDATAKELSKETQIAIDDVILALESNTEVESLHKVIYQGEGNTICLMDKLEDNVDSGELVIDRLFLENLLKQLKPEERNIIVLRYFYNQTQSQIANKLGISQVQVSRLEKRILESMREKIK